MSEILQPSEWARPKGYANGVAARGRMIFIAGQIGWDLNGQFTSDRLTDQVKQALRNVVRALRLSPSTSQRPHGMGKCS